MADELLGRLSGSVTSPLEETRPRRFLTLLDLERLCLRVLSAGPLAVKTSLEGPRRGHGARCGAAGPVGWPWPAGMR